ncbi:hypothetical protein G7054_g23 [Neopestalotiopsis clavispora]|nr:hypothetical protein G7054_g23 [Neopestalotiopsis clavispora]
MYAIAKKRPNSNVRLSINSDNVSSGDTIEQVSVLNIILVKVGPDEILYDDGEDDEEFLSYPPQLVLRIQNHGHNVQIGKFQIGCYPTDPNLQSNANFSVARNWLRRCRNEHVECRFDYTPVLPSRVIDVGFDEEFQDTRLLLSDGFEAEYVDAIVVTRQLGFRYLWIDSLCIIQTSKQDWEQESRRMDSVYGNATVTLSAMASGASTEGILKYIPLEISPPPVSLRVFSESNDTNVIIKRDEPTAEDLDWLDTKGPLSSRGWTLQEFVLSPRHLLYGAHQIYWKCAVGYISASGLTNGPRFPQHGYDGIAAIIHSQFRPGDEQKHALSSENMLDEYYKMVETFSHRNLTVGSDKLPAFSGLARRLHKFLRGQYLAGLWSCDIGRGLCWYREMDSAKHVSRYRAPSWSWAVTDERILFAAQSDTAVRDHPLAVQMIAFDIQPRHESNPYGEIQSGSLTLRGLTRPLVCSRQVITYAIGNDASHTLFLDEKEDQYPNDLNTISNINHEGSHHLVAFHEAFSEETPGLRIDPELFDYPELKLLYIQRTSHSDHFLVIKTVSTSQGSTYKRIGLSRADVQPREDFAGWEMQTIVLI